MDKTTEDNNIKEQQDKKDSFTDWEPLDLKLKPGAKDWITKDYRDEIFDERYNNSK
ncbi:MAG: hypothetical protein J6U56_03400 [Spirochaetia bacterium]|nr:hypothetical protein [Spirochaetia bacterium]